MKKCIQCGGTRFERRGDRHIVEVAGHRFTGEVPVEACVACGETYTSADAIEHVELAAAAKLADSGAVDGESFRFMRHALGFTAKDLATELRTTAETISRWENGTRGVDPLAWATVAAMVRDRLEGSTRTLEQLKAIREPRKLAKAVRIEQRERASR
jgi:YgiT-type zinc finger domain-containing protein